MTERAGISSGNLKLNAAAVLFARLTAPSLNIVLVAGITRVIGFELLGQYTLLLTLVLLADAAKSMGLHYYVVREVAKSGPEAAGCYQSLIRIGLIGTVVLFPIVILLAGASSPRLYAPGAVMAMALLPGCITVANDSVFLARGKANITATVTLIENSLRLSVSLVLVLWVGGGILALSAAYTGARLLAAAMGLLAMRRTGGRFPAHDTRITQAMLRRAPEFSGVFVLPMVLFRLDVLLLGVLTNDYYVGVYSAGMRFISVIVLIPDSIMSATYALLSKLAGPSDAGEFHRLVERTIQALSMFLTPIAILLVLSAPLSLRAVFGAKSGPAIGILQILAWSMAPFALTRAVGDSLVAVGGQRGVALAIGATTIVSSVLYVVLIRQYGAMGSAIAFFGSAVILLALLATYQPWAPRRVTSARQLMKALGPSFLAAAVFFGFNSENRTAAVVAVYVLSTAIVNWKIAQGLIVRAAER